MITWFTLSFSASKAAKLKGVFFSMYRSIQSVDEVKWGMQYNTCWMLELHLALTAEWLKKLLSFLWPQITISCMCSISSSWLSAIPTLDSLWNSHISQTLASIATINTLHINWQTLNAFSSIKVRLWWIMPCRNTCHHKDYQSICGIVNWISYCFGPPYHVTWWPGTTLIHYIVFGCYCKDISKFKYTLTHTYV